MAAIYAVMNRKGGVGKTTTAVTLAHGLALRLRKETGTGYVLIVDLDPQGHVAKALGVKHNGQLADVLLDPKQDIREAVVPAHREGLFVLPSSDRLADAKIDLLSRHLAEVIDYRRRRRRRVTLDEILSTRLAPANEAFDYIIVDCPPSLDMLEDAVYRYADAAIVPVKPDYLGTAGTVQHTTDILDAQTDGFDIRIEVIVPTFFRSREVLANQMYGELRDMFGKQKVADPIPQAAVLEQAPATRQQTIFEYAPEHPAARAYAKLVNRIYGNGR